VLLVLAIACRSQGSCPGVCQDNSLPCNGTYVAGLCPGPNNIQCCESNGPNPPPGEGYYGVDVSDYVSGSTAGCMVQSGLSFAAVRCWHSTGSPDSNAPGSVSNLNVAGFTRVDVYMFPCYSCGDGGGQVSRAVSYLQGYSVNFSVFWFDIEGPSYWSSDQSSNAAFFNAMRSEGQSLGLNMGVYTGWNQWPQIMGSLDASDLPLWYPHYDNTPSFNDFQSFNNWNSPTWKQYADSGPYCGGDYDADWAPSPAAGLHVEIYDYNNKHALKHRAKKAEKSGGRTSEMRFAKHLRTFKPRVNQ